MIARSIESSDTRKIRELHESYFNDHEMIDFNRLLCGFVILNDDNEIVMAGGVKPVAETLLITDKSKSLVSIGRALIEALNISKFTCNKFKIDELNAFVMNDNQDYIKHLVKHGFNIRNDQVSLRMKVDNG